MWIIPKNLHTSLSAQVMEGLISDSNELSQICEQSLLVRSKRSSLRTWSQKLNRDSWTQHLYGRTLRLSHSKNFTEEWASSVVEYPVSPSVEQVEEEQTKIQDTSSLTLFEVFESLHQNWSSSKMSKECTVQSSKEKDGATQQEPLFCSMSLENWKGEVTRQRQAHSQRLKQERLTYEKDASSLQSGKNWATVRVGASKAPMGGGDPSKYLYQFRLENQVQPTLQREGWSNTGGNHQESHNWATPNTMDHLTPKSEETTIRQALTVRKGRSSPSNLREQVDERTVEIYRELKNWATPNAGTKNHEGSLEHYQRRVEIGKQISLHGQVLLNAQDPKNWATPLARDYKGRCPKSTQEDPTKRTRNYLPDQAHMNTYRGKLNPRWVETLMGLPIGWTMPSCTNPLIIEQTNYECLETESCQTPQLQRSEYSGKNWKTPTSRQRGDTVEVYLRRSIKRFKKGGVPFAIQLEMEAEAMQKGLKLDNLWDRVKEMIDLDTEEIIEKILNN